jgi:hypothetical protein
MAVLAASAVALTHDEWVAEVNPICKSEQRKVNKIRKETSTGSPIDRAVTSGKRFSKVRAKTIRQVREFKPPPEDAALAKKWRQGLALQKRAIDDFVSAIGDRDRGEAGATIRKFFRVGAKNREKAAKLGLPACARRANPS